MFISRAHEGLALLGEDGGCTLDIGVNERDYLEAGAELTVKEREMGGMEAV